MTALDHLIKITAQSLTTMEAQQAYFRTRTQDNLRFAKHAEEQLKATALAAKKFIEAEQSGSEVVYDEARDEFVPKQLF